MRSGSQGGSLGRRRDGSERPPAGGAIAAAWRALLLALTVYLGEAAAWFATGVREEFTLDLLASTAIALLAGGVAAVLATRLTRFPSVALAVAAPAVLLATSAGIELFDSRAAAIAFGVTAGTLLTGFGTWLVGRRWGATAVAVLALASVAAGTAYHHRERPAAFGDGSRPPDVILLVLDTTRRDALGVYSGGSTTPHLDAFARGADVHDNAWSVSPWTPPSHASMLTGRLPSQHGVDGEALPDFPGDVPRLHEALRKAGYRTAAFVANPNLTGPGWPRGFDEFRPCWFHGRSAVSRWIHLGLDGAPYGGGWGTGTTARVFSLFRLWWRLHPDQPRFVLINVLDAHRPYDPPSDVARRFLSREEETEARAIDQDPVSYTLHPGLDERPRRLLRGLYDAEITAMDVEIGRCLAWLRDRGDLDATFLVVTSDHGEHLGEFGRVGHDLIMDDRLLRVPLLVKRVGQSAGRRLPDLVQLDRLPEMILDATGVTVDAPERFRPSHRPPAGIAIAQYAHPQWFLTRVTERDPKFVSAVYDGDWSYVSEGRYGLLARVRSGATIPWSLVDLTDASVDRPDLSATQPEILRQMIGVAAALPAFRSRDPSRDREIDEETTRRLRSLGYVN